MFTAALIGKCVQRRIPAHVVALKRLEVCHRFSRIARPRSEAKVGTGEREGARSGAAAHADLETIAEKLQGNIILEVLGKTFVERHASIGDQPMGLKPKIS